MIRPKRSLETRVDVRPNIPRTLYGYRYGKAKPLHPDIMEQIGNAVYGISYVVTATYPNGHVKAYKYARLNVVVAKVATCQHDGAVRVVVTESDNGTSRVIQDWYA